MIAMATKAQNPTMPMLIHALRAPAANPIVVSVSLGPPLKPAPSQFHFRMAGE